MSAAPRALAATAIACGSAAGTLALATSIQRASGSGLTRLDDAVAVGVQVIGAAVLLWYLVTALIALGCLGARAAGAVWVAGEERLAHAGAPLARRLLGVGAGVAVAAAAVVAPAAGATSPAFELEDDLGWGATQDADDEPTSEPTPDDSPSTTPPSADPSAPPPPSSPGSSGSRPTTAVPAAAPTDGEDEQPDYVVVSGDTLWDIAAAHLADSADDADIAAAWPDWYAVNRDVIGSDPDLIHPGQVLVAPDDQQEDA